MSPDQSLPPALAEIAEEFHAVPEPQRLELLLEYADELPSLPDRFATDRAGLERVPECQSPLFVLVEPQTPADPTGPVRLYFDAPAQAPTARGFAAIMFTGLDGLRADEVLAVPDDVPTWLGLAGLVSPLRRNGMTGLLRRIKQQVRAKTAGTDPQNGPGPR